MDAIDTIPGYACESNPGDVVAFEQLLKVVLHDLHTTSDVSQDHAVEVLEAQMTSINDHVQSTNQLG